MSPSDLMYHKVKNCRREKQSLRTSVVLTEQVDDADDIVMSHWQSEPLRPSHYIVRQKNEVILGIRGMACLVLPLAILSFLSYSTLF